MYCTVKAFLSTQENIERYLNNVQDTYISKSGEVLKKGKLENMKVNTNGGGILIEGSLAKYYFNNNLETLTLSQSKEAIEKLSDSLHTDTSKANVYRVDFATNFIVTEPPKNFYPCLIEISRMNRMPLGNSLYFKNNTRALVFYDKNKEAIAKKMMIPEQFRNKNILRYELRNLKYSRKKRTLKKLAEISTYNELLDEWLNGFQSIKKVQTLQVNREVKMIGLKNIQLEGIRLWILQNFGCIDSFYQFLDSEQNKGTINRQNKSDWKKKIEKAFNQPDLIQPGSLLTELNQRVKEAYELYKN